MLDSKISGITRFLYQFCKILPKYCGRKENDHNILWSKWYSRRESNPQRPLRRGLLYPFNYGSILNFITRGRNDCQKKFYTKIYTNFFPPRENKHKSSGFARKTCVLGNALWIEQNLRRGLLYPFNYGSVLNFIPATEIIAGKLFRGLLINLNGVKNPAPDIDNTGAPKSYSFCHISSNGLI